MIDTPILFLLFNRPDTTLRVFETICKQKPTKLYVAADGPRTEKTGERELCDEAKSIIHKIDWECEVKTLFREENLGCKLAISTAINWFFQQEERGIILEDDCLPCASFFPFCEQMLNKYQNDTEIMMISGTNYLFGKHNKSNGYYKSTLTPIWGWATWKRAWDKMNLDISIPDPSIVYNRFKNVEYSNYLLKSLQSANEKKINSWAIYWSFSIIINKGYSLVPLKNQVSNIGVEGTHTGTIQSLVHFMPTSKIYIQKAELISEKTRNENLDNLSIENILLNIKRDSGYRTPLEIFKAKVKDSFIYRTNLFLNIFKKLS